jgi:hypothetical protein
MTDSQGLSLVDMPTDGLFRAGRYSDLLDFPAPADKLSLRGPPLRDGYRWEDLRGRFATIKYSRSTEGAVGRTIVRFQERVIAGVSLVDLIKSVFSDEPDDGEPELVPNRVPEAYFEDAHLLWLPQQEGVMFVDLEDPETLEVLHANLAPQLADVGLRIRSGLAHDERDRRVTRLVMSSLHAICAAPGYEHVAGIRYAGESHVGWDAYVAWNRPRRLDVGEAATEPLYPSHRAVLAAAKTLSLDLP